MDFLHGILENTLCENKLDIFCIYFNTIYIVN